MRCKQCLSTGLTVSETVGLCRSCILKDREETEGKLKAVHERVRRRYSLPPQPPRVEGAPQCRICSQSCSPGEGEKGYCGLRENRDGCLKHLAGVPAKGLLEFYFDHLPTNCVADFVCPAREVNYHGRKNLAVFYGACTLNCLFCQNWHYRTLTGQLEPLYSAKDLANQVDEGTACICFFGGDPAPQAPHALAAAHRALKKRPDLFVCWETSGLMKKEFLQKMIDHSVQSGGTLKFDIKAYHPSLYFALTGSDNRQVLENFAYCARFSREKGVTLAVASTLLVPGYVEEDEVYAIASFIAAQDPDIPYSLLGFFPRFQMQDLPPSSRRQAEACYRAARQAGLTRVNLGNEHLLL